MTLIKNIRANNFQNIIALNVAAWNEPGELRLYLGPNSGEHSVKDLSSRWKMVQAETLDSIVAQNNLSRVDWIKVDVEGAEVEVLQGAQGVMRKMKPRMIAEVRLENRAMMKRLLSRVEYGVVQISPSVHPAGCWYWFLTPLDEPLR